MSEPARTMVSDEQKRDAAREILRAAARFFADRGFDATSVREIVEAAGVTKPTLYYHFGSKEGLAQALLSRPMRRLIEELRSIAERPGDPVEALSDQIEAHFAFCREEPDRARFVYALFFGPNTPGLSSQVAVYGKQMTDLLNETTRRLARSGMISEDRSRRCAAVVQGLITIYTADYLYQGANLETGLARRLVEDLLLGFAADRTGVGTGNE
ncbi:TetR/AcrR family transcriptional regulator [Tautonia marina]|uniref:TetR/AcrR family transcriptional regulator n=1 Tax=Tautonia marina TaxID=2653855 RepID=UPI001F36A5E7|nr:TetR/AcrR family transcriptional regulator [Tautonia marina]